LRAKKPLKVPKPLALATVRKYVIALETVLKWHAKNRGTVLNEFLFDFNSKVVPSAWSEPRERRLLQGEENLLYANGVDRGGYTYTEHDWRMVLGFTLETGMRRQEVTLAKWTDIKSEGYKLFIPKKNAKTKKDRMALLSRRAREIIEMQRATCPKGDERIFHQFPSSAALGSAFAALTTRAEVSGLTFHDLRHEATSRLCESGKLKLMEIMEMTGHDTMRTFRRYVKLIAHENDRRLD